MLCTASECQSCERALQNWIAHKTLLRIKLVSLYWLKMADLKWLNGLRCFRALIFVCLVLFFLHMLRSMFSIYHRFGYRSFAKTCEWFLSRIQIQIDSHNNLFVFVIIRLEFFTSHTHTLRNRSLRALFSSASFWQMCYNFSGCLLLLFYGPGWSRLIFLFC